ncbi:MAG: hypothetical protein KKC26_01050 [Nanoarchaeota archaeon]|nr:hypothetical protein [Nanoarchaeota archaeon]
MRELKTQIIGKSMIFIVLTILLMLFSSAILSISKEEYFLGETIIIGIDNPDNYSLSISSGKDVFKYLGGLQSEITFSPKQTGIYTIELYSSSGVLEKKNVVVLNEKTKLKNQISSEKIYLNKDQYSIGETVLIIILEEFDDLKIINEENEYRFLGGVQQEITFIPNQVGNYSIEATLSYGEILQQDFIVTNEDNLSVQDLVIKPVQYQFKEINLLDSKNERKNNSLKIIQEQNGLSDAELLLENQTVKKVKFKKIDLSAENIDFKIEKVPKERIQNQLNKTIDAFAIDPTNLVFEKAEVTITAVGTELWKCKDYNYTTQTCYGTFTKIADLIPGKEYTFTLTPEDPVFSQTGYLTNPSFTADTGGWTTLSENPVSYQWITTDSGQDGVAEIYQTGRAKSYIGNYYQTFTLTIPAGTTLDNINFSALWRINQYDQPGNVYLWIQDSGRITTYCSWTQSFSSTTAWATGKVTTRDAGCLLSSFSPGTTYTFRLRCNLVTGTSIKDERCHWDEAAVVVYYNDTQAPTINSWSETPDPVSIGGTINITANVTDNIETDKVWIDLDGSTYYLTQQGTSNIWYYDTFDTNIVPDLYFYNISANDTSNNLATIKEGNFTIADETPPHIIISAPKHESFQKNNPLFFNYTATDTSPIANCSLVIDGTPVATDYLVTSGVEDSISHTPSYGYHEWQINCTDDSSNHNTNTSLTWNFTYDNIAPDVNLNNPEDNTWITTNTVVFNYTPIDDYLSNCTLWGNFSAGIWAVQETQLTPTSNQPNTFAPIILSDGFYLWNVQCNDTIRNTGWNNTNFTLKIDATPPAWSDNKTSPESGITHTPIMSYQFNMTWQDALNGLDIIQIEHDFYGSLQKDPSTGNNGAEHYFNIQNLPAGTYQYKWYANDTLGNLNVTDFFTYIINKTQSVVNLTLNESDENYYLGLNEFSELEGFLITPTTGYIELYIEGVLVASGTDYVQNISQFTEEKSYNITVVYPATQNYSYSYETHYVIVTDTTDPEVSLDAPENESWEKGTVILYYTPKDNIAITNCTLILDGQINQSKDSTNNVQSNFTLSGLDDGTHYWNINCSDLVNNTGTNETSLFFYVDTILPTTFNLLTPLSGTVSTNLNPTLSWQQTSEDNFEKYFLQVDNDKGFGSPYFEEEIFDITNTSVIAGPLADQIRWFWRVTAFDKSGNNRTSTQIFNYTTDTINPVVTLNYPEPVKWINYYEINFNYTVTDLTALLNCSLIINEAMDQTNFTIIKNSYNYFKKTFVGDGEYNWSVRCFDSAKNSHTPAARKLHIDTTLPSPFDLSTPKNNTLSNNKNPLLNWSQTTEDNLNNYTVFVSNTSEFTEILYQYYAYDVLDTDYQVIDNWIDGTYYWQVEAYDLAGNNRTSNQDYIYRLDATPPTIFTLLTPSSGTESTNLTPLLKWTQSTDDNFVNYTIYVSDNNSFVYSNFTYVINTSAITEFQVSSSWPTNTKWYWFITAYDNATNTRDSSQTFVYTTDTDLPQVNLMSPEPFANWTSSTTVSFEYNVSDFGTIENCTLVINGTDYKYDTIVVKDSTETILQGLDNGNYNWSVRCVDLAGNTGYSSARLLSVNVTIPTHTLWETATGGPFSGGANINLNYYYDLIENSILIDIPAATSVHYMNATYTVGGSGFIISEYTNVDFSAVFTGERAGEAYVSWWFYISNFTGSYLLCNFGNNDATGTIISSKLKVAYIGACTSTLAQKFLNPGDKLILSMYVYQGGVQQREYTHFWDNADASWVMFDGYRLGTLSSSFVNLSDPQPTEGTGFIEQCNITCADGDCMNTEVYLQYKSGGTWMNVNGVGNISLNVTQSNPVILGTVNSTIIVNFSLLANTYSFNNSFRCFADSIYDSATSGTKNISVIDRTPPNVTLVSPDNNDAFDPQIITFKYTPYDVRLTNCTLWGNFTGIWNATNQTNLAPINGDNNTFSLYLSYGKYSWNVKCFDEADNYGFASENYTIIIAGDLEISSSSISFSNNNPVEGQQVVLFVNITNNANKNETNFVVQFWRGDPDGGGVQINSNIITNITALGSVIVNTTWTAVKGLSEIYVVVDPPYGSGNIIESDESNNKDSRNITISIWQIYYGNVNATLLLASSTTKNFTAWVIETFEGNIYITDSDTTLGISWQYLKPITRDNVQQFTANTQNDFNEIDSLLGTTNYPENVNITFSENSNPKKTSVFEVYGVEIFNVPVVNSTNTASFITGILWDSDDSSNSYFDSTDAEDLVFITKINQSKIGAFGTYDYEIKIPEDLKSYKGVTETVDLYYELK